MNVPPDFDSEYSKFSLSKEAVNVPDISFEEFLLGEGKSEKSSMVKVGALSYRMISFDTGEALEASYEELPLRQKENKPTNVDDAPATQPVSNIEEKQQDLSFNLGAQAFFIKPIDPSFFISTLPESLKSFISEVVQVVKHHNIQTQQIDYHFKFHKLDLSVLISSTDDKIVIQVGVENSQLKSDLFTEEKQQQLLTILQQSLKEEEIELRFLDQVEFPTKEGSSDSSQDDASSQNKDLNDEEQDEEN